jgi:BMFP domain-containing protein YqiC
MAGRPSGTGSPPSSALRLEILKELQSILDDREVRERLDRGPISETKGREHWVLHLLLRAQEQTWAHIDVLIGTAYSNLTARLQALEDRLQRMEGSTQALGDEVKTRLEGIEGGVVERIGKELQAGLDAGAQKIAQGVGNNLDTKWKPVGDSVEAFAQRSSQLTKDLSDTFRVATQNRLLLNENARRTIDLGRDIVALEESLKLALSKVLEDGLQPLEQRIAAIEARLGNGEVAADSDPSNDSPADG